MGQWKGESAVGRNGDDGGDEVIGKLGGEAGILVGSKFHKKFSHEINYVICNFWSGKSDIHTH